MMAAQVGTTFKIRRSQLPFQLPASVTAKAEDELFTPVGDLEDAPGPLASD